MKELTLEAYMNIRGIKVAQLAKEIGASRQNIDNWLAGDATLELVGSGIHNIKITTQKVVHESQVMK